MARREELKTALQSLLEERLKVQLTGPLEEQSRINEDLRVDSIMLLQLIVFIEQELRLSVPEEEVDAKAFATIGSLLDFMERLEPLDGARAGSPAGAESLGGTSASAAGAGVAGE
ncbi:petrobactin biosynthesis protein AsbD [Paenibacillus oenotherae]|uniref:Petrobactin biosynthesis protein AsbD n=1 Tax=Paenibacillus oenotherae TaxID=1435645 RepID=A0ABS7D524_9BACL|nr:petrobactin biosynthesis protein AsbD [Paenibacillus oenotherae]